MREEITMRIGVLDDDPAICGMLRELLELTGHEVAVYNNPWDILMALFHNDPPTHLFDALIIDILLPDLLGSQVIQQIREHFVHLPIIVISALPGVALNTIHEKFPTIIVLKKPFALKDLLMALEHASGQPQTFTLPIS
jgi:DNA-binding response OmpR family regulator